jgi:hypothetical protein
MIFPPAQKGASNGGPPRNRCCWRGYLPLPSPAGATRTLSPTDGRRRRPSDRSRPAPPRPGLVRSTGARCHIRLCRDEEHCHDEFEQGTHRGAAGLLVRRASAPAAHRRVPYDLQRTQHARRTCCRRGEANVLRCACGLAPRDDHAPDDGVAPGMTSRRSPRPPTRQCGELRAA